MAVLPPGGSFVDDDGNVHEGGIEAIAAEGITRGCNPPANDRYCPENTVTRCQMAVFLARALYLDPTSDDYFIDYETSLFEAGINRLAAAGITQSCNPPANNRFCPDRDMTRGQIAAMLARAFDYPVSHHNRFNYDNGHIFEQAIQKIAAAGVTVGLLSTSQQPVLSQRSDQTRPHGHSPHPSQPPHPQPTTSATAAHPGQPRRQIRPVPAAEARRVDTSDPDQRRSATGTPPSCTSAGLRRRGRPGRGSSPSTAGRTRSPSPMAATAKIFNDTGPGSSSTAAAW